MLFVSDILGILLTTSLTGGILTLIWMGIGTLLEKWGRISIRYELLRIVMFFYLFPIVYVVLMIMQELFQLWNGTLFMSLLSTDTCTIILIVWALVSCFVFCIKLIQSRRSQRIIQTFFDPAPEYEDLLKAVAEELQLKNIQIRIGYSELAEVPEVRGCRRPMVLLPLDIVYSEDELRMVLLHELSHLKHKDLWMYALLRLITSVHCFNPMAWQMKKYLLQWSEEACDAEVCRHVEDMSLYGALLFNTNQRKQQEGALYFARSKNHEIIRRLERMKHLKKKNHHAKKTVVVVALGMVISLFMVTSASALVAEQYVKLYEAATVGVEEARTGNTLIEYTDSNSDPMLLSEDDGEPAVMAEGVFTFDWDGITPDFMKKTGFRWAEAGGTIIVSIQIKPGDAEAKVGIVQPNGVQRYVYGSGSFSHTFAVTQTGYHRIFVVNTSDENIDAAGSYIIDYGQS